VGLVEYRYTPLLLLTIIDLLLLKATSGCKIRMGLGLGLNYYFNPCHNLNRIICMSILLIAAYGIYSTRPKNVI